MILVIIQFKGLIKINFMEKRYTEKEYNILNETDKVVFVSFLGALIDRRVEAEYGINLYSLYDFYVEVWRSRKHDEILHVRTFTDIEYLDPYLEKIELSILLDIQ